MAGGSKGGGMAGGSKGGGNKFQTGQVNDSNMAQIQQLLQLLNANPWLVN